jgi:hypothetical protein
MATESRAASNESATKNALVTVLDIVRTLNGEARFNSCSPVLDAALGSCKFSTELVDGDKYFEQNAMLAANLASKLTALSLNEKIENKVFITRPNVYSMFRTSLVDFEGVNDVKIVFKRFGDKENVAFHASKKLQTKCEDKTDAVFIF